MKLQLSALLLGAILIASCKKDANELTPAVSQSQLTAAAKSATPFQGYINFQFSTTQNLPCDCGSYYPVGTFSGTGIITHLGNASCMIKPCVAPLMNGDVHYGDHVGVECGEFTSANGDKIYCYTHPFDLLYTATAAVGNTAIDFVGGTGRFQNATGSITGTVTVPYGTGTASFTNINGTISY